jgi:molybdopterin-containing oxidoreductase family membrane subunit
MKSLAGLLATFVAVDAFFIGCECLTMGYPGAGEATALSIMTTGATAPFFWFEIIGGLLIPFLILVFSKNRERTGAVVAASALIVAGVCCKRLWLLFTSFITPNVDGAPGITLGTQTAQQGGSGMWTLLGTYAPTGFETLIVIGVISLGVLAYMVLSMKLLGSASHSGKTIEAVQVDVA